MKILKAYRQPSRRSGKEVLDWHYFILVDEEPEITYEKIGQDYVGSSKNENGEVISSHYLKKQSYGDAFAGREIRLNMKDGDTEVIKNYWFDHGSYPEHGTFTSVGIGTPESLKDIYVYHGSSIETNLFSEMLSEYLENDTFHKYYDIRKWLADEYHAKV